MEPQISDNDIDTAFAKSDVKTATAEPPVQVAGIPGAEDVNGADPGPGAQLAAPVRPASDDITVTLGQGPMPTTATGLWWLSGPLAESGVVKGASRQQVFTILSYGAALGLNPMATVSNIVLVNGRVTLMGDAMMAMIMKSGKLDEFVVSENMDVKPGTPVENMPDGYGFTVMMRRNDLNAAFSNTFTVADARLAGLLGKSGPWKQYPKRMLKYRALGMTARDAFSDLLMGVHAWEELAAGDPDVHPDAFDPKRMTTASEELRARVEARQGEHVIEVTPEAE